MSDNRLTALLDVYLENIPLVTYDGCLSEEFKWTAVRIFQEQWNPDAEDWVPMLKAAFHNLATLVTGRYNQPVDGLIALAKIPGETERFLKPRFQELFSEDGGDLNTRMDRVNSFLHALNAELRDRFPTRDSFQQSTRSVLAYLTLWRPEENYYYMYSKAKNWQKYAGFDGDIRSGEDFSLSEYYRMCDGILQDLQNFPRVLEAIRKCKDTELPDYDDRGHIMVYDLLYCSDAYKLYEKAGLTPIRKAAPPRSSSPGESSSRSSGTREMTKLLEDAQALEDKIRLLDERLGQLEEPAPLPDLMGAVIHHSRWGDGTVVNLPGASIWIQFPNKLHKAVRDQFLRNSCVSLDIPWLEAEKRNKALENERKNLSLERERLSRDREEKMRLYNNLQTGL